MAEMRQFTKDCHKADVLIHGTFILGLPVETQQSIQNTMDFAKELDVFSIQVSLAAPYPGTELWDIVIKEKGRSLEGRWEDFTQMAGFTSSNPLYVSEGRSARALKNLQKMANALYYLKPSVLIGMYLRFNKMGRRKEFFMTLFTGIRAICLPFHIKQLPSQRQPGGI